MNSVFDGLVQLRRDCLSDDGKVTSFVRDNQDRLETCGNAFLNVAKLVIRSRRYRYFASNFGFTTKKCDIDLSSVVHV